MRAAKFMIRITQFAISLFIVGYSFGQKVNYTELGLNYFLNNIYSKDFTESKIRFSGFTESKIPEFIPHFQNADSIVNQLYKNIDSSELDMALNIEQENEFPKIKKHRGKRKLELFVYPQVEQNGMHYVYLGIYRAYRFVQHYLIELDDYGKVTNYWHTSEII